MMYDLSSTILCLILKPILFNLFLNQGIPHTLSMLISSISAHLRDRASIILLEPLIKLYLKLITHKLAHPSYLLPLPIGSYLFSES